MKRHSSVIEERLGSYRPTLEDAIAHRSSRPGSGNAPTDNDLVDADWDSAPLGRPAARSRAVVGAMAVALIAGLGVFLATRSREPSTAPSSTPESLTAATGSVGNSNEATVDTALAEILPGSGLTPACPAGIETIGTGTLYLGGPASDQNLATIGFIFSLPAGPTPVDLAIEAIALPVIGHECSITAAPTADDHVVSVVVDPPAVPAPLHFDVTVSETDGIIGVTRIDGATSFDVTATAATPSLRLLDGVPSSAEKVQVRFKKGDDVWELSADPKPGTDIPLTVPSRETDNFSNEPIDWVLFTLIGANERIVGAGGQVI